MCTERKTRKRLLHAMAEEEQPPLGLLGTVSPSLKDYHLIEQFIIVGLPHNYHVESHFHNERQVHEPQVIYKYPPDKPYALSFSIYSFPAPSFTLSLSTIHLHNT